MPCNPGRYHLEAAIAAEHATAAQFSDTNWTRIAALYELLEKLTGSPVVSVSKAIADNCAGHASDALAALEALAAHPALTHYPPYYSALEEVHRSLGNVAKGSLVDYWEKGG